MAQMPALSASAATPMRYGSHQYGSPGRHLGNILALVVIGFLVLSLLAWLGYAAPVSCQLGRGLDWLVASRLFESLALICFVAWMLTLFTWHTALILAVIIMFGLAWSAAEVPALLASC